MIHGLSIDVEDYHQIVHRNYLRKEIVPSPEVERNTRFLLDTFGQAGVKATFFVLATVARHYPGLIKRMAAEGHEIGVHGYEHSLIYAMTPDAFHENIGRAKDEIENIAGCAVHGHRAPAFSITRDSFWALDVLKELGYVYDSSIYPIRGKRYGIPDAQKNIFRWKNGLYEIPLSCIELLGMTIPVAGGGYVRYFPFVWTRYAIARLAKAGRPSFSCIHTNLSRRPRRHIPMTKIFRRLSKYIMPFRQSTGADGKGKNCSVFLRATPLPPLKILYRVAVTGTRICERHNQNSKSRSTNTPWHRKSLSPAPLASSGFIWRNGCLRAATRSSALTASTTIMTSISNTAASHRPALPVIRLSMQSPLAAAPLRDIHSYNSSWRTGKTLPHCFPGSASTRCAISRRRRACAIRSPTPMPILTATLWGS